MFDGNGHRSPGSETSLDASDADAGPGAAAPHPDDVFGALSTGERRYLLYGLLEKPTQSFDEVADVVAGYRAGSRGPVGPEERRRIASRLHHVHLPMLQDAGLLRYDHEAGRVSLRDLPRRVLDLVRFAREYDRTGGGQFS